MTVSESSFVGLPADRLGSLQTAYAGVESFELVCLARRMAIPVRDSIRHSILLGARRPFGVL